MTGNRALSQLLTLRGINNSGTAQVALRADGTPQFFLSGGTNLSDFLQRSGWGIQPVLLSPVGESARYSVAPPSLIINEISDPDSHSRALLQAETFRSHFPGVYCLNEPATVRALTRSEVSRRLHGLEGVIMPKTRHFTINSRNDVLDLLERNPGPVLLRKAGEHNGRNTVLVNAIDEIDRTDCLPLDGSTYYLTDFVDFRSDDGLYRKWRLVVIGGEAYLRHMITGEHWMVHSESRLAAYAHEETLALATFESELKPCIAGTCRRIAEALELDYFGIDCSIRADNALLIFEANPNMNILVNTDPTPNMFEQPIATILEALNTYLEARIAA